MEVAFISGPYRAKTIRGIRRNIAAAESVALEYWGKGYAVICPHTNCALMDGEAPDKVFLDGDMELLKRSDLCVMMRGWEKSEGAKAEHRFAKMNGIKVVYAG